MTTANAVARWKHFVAFVAAAFSCVVLAQQPQPPATGDSDPPVRVGRVSYVSGTVSFSPGGSDQWVEARPNRPIVTGDNLWADADSRAELATDNSTWWLGDSTSVTVSNLDDRIVQMQVQEGTLEVSVRRLPSGNLVEIDTPNLAFSVTRAGLYRVEVDPRDGSTTLSVRDGSGEVYGENASYVINDGQAYRFYGTDVSDSEFVALPPRDAFDQFVEERDRRYASSASLRYVSPEVIGYEDLDRYGTWSTEATYGGVWFPRETQAGWAPYREGHWAWIDPWGWTWVDDEPWGFAPFHYGRWAHFSRGWGWVPGPRSVRAVYAPALVAFVGGAGFGLTVSSGPAIGWFPLAPREVYVPPYRVSRNYFRQVNVSNTVVNVTNITNIYNNPSRVSQLTYVNRRAPNAVTAVPPAAFAQAQNVRRAAIDIPAAAMQRAQVQAVAPVAPARPAFLGAAPAARAKPSAAVINRAVVAKAPPPPRPIPDAQKLPALERNPGRPLTGNELQTLRRAAAPAAAAQAPVKVVTPPKPAANAAPPARAAGAPRPAQVPGAAPQRPAAPPTPSSEALRQRAAPGAAPEQAPKGPPAARPPQAQPPAPGAESKGPPASAPRGLPPALQRREATPPGGAPAPEAGRPTPQPPQRAPEARVLRPPQPAPEAQPAPERSPQERLQPRPAPERPQPQAAPQRPPQERLQPRPAPERPQPQAAPQRPPQERLQPRPAPERPQPQPTPQERLQPRPAPPPQAAPQRPPQERPQPRPAPEARPQPQPLPAPAARPAPERPPQERLQPRPPPQAQPQPAPAARPAPQRPQPPAKDQKEKGKDNDRKEGGG